MARSAARSNPTIESLRERMSRDPFSRAFLQLAEEYRRTGQYEDAVKVCLEGLSRHPAYHTARIALGRTYLEMGDLERARRALSEVIELMPENHLAGKLLAEVQRKMGDLPGAVATYRSILGHYPGDREVEMLLRDLLGPAAPTSAPASIAPPPGAARAGTAPAPPAVARSAPEARRAAPVAAAPPPPALRASEPTLDYRPEDLSARGATDRRPGPGPVEGGEGEPDAIQTNTLAELYLRQGMVERAIEVYRAMLRVDPRNTRARSRLSELDHDDGARVAAQTRDAAGTPAIDAPAPVVPLVVPRSMTEVAPARDMARPTMSPAATTPPAGAPTPRRQAVARLERWLEAVRRGARGSPGARP